jgi:UDP-N-acetylglucosamine pyrophosphorylase
MPQLCAIIQSRNDGAASEQSRVLCKNSNMRPVVSVIGTAFLSMIPAGAGSIFPP